MQDLAGGEAGALQVEDGVHDILDLAHVSHGEEAGQVGEGLDGMHRGLDDPGGDRVDAYAPARELDGQRLGGCVQSTLGQRGEHRRHAGDRLVHQARRDADDVTRSLLQHLRGGALGDVEEAIDVDPHHQGVVLARVLGERLREKDARVVDQGVDPAEALESLLHDPLSGGRVADIAGDREHVRIVALLDGAGGGDHPIIAVAIGLNQACADPL